jgi:hypothetical protein
MEQLDLIQHSNLLSYPTQQMAIRREYYIRFWLCESNIKTSREFLSSSQAWDVLLAIVVALITNLKRESSHSRMVQFFEFCCTCLIICQWFIHKSLWNWTLIYDLESSFLIINSEKYELWSQGTRLNEHPKLFEACHSSYSVDISIS